SWLSTSVSTDSSEDSVGIPARRVILFGTIPTTIPDTIPSNPSEDPSSDHVLPLPAISQFLSSADDTTDSDTPDTHHLPIPIPHGRPYHYHPNRPVHMMTARKRVRPLPVQQLAIHHQSNHQFSFGCFLPPDPHRDTLIVNQYLPDLPSTSVGPSRHMRPSVTYEVRTVGYLERWGSDEPHLEQDIDPEIQAEIDECFAYVDALKDRGIVEAVDQVESETGARGPIEVRVERVMHLVMPDDILEPAQEGAVEVTYETLGDLVQRIVGVESTVTALTEMIAKLERDNRRLRCTASVESQRVDQLQRGMSRMQRKLRQIQQLRFYDRVRVGRFKAKMPNIRSRASRTHREIEDLIAHRVSEEIEAREAAMNLEPLNGNGGKGENGNGGNGGNGNGGNGENGNRGNGGNGNGGNGKNGNGGNGGNGNGGNGENRNGNRNRNHGMNYGGFMPVAGECTSQDFLKCKP
ncbi:hypothetical protein Tco_1009961, partial [Tanacetum coccineum]